MIAQYYSVRREKQGNVSLSDVNRLKRSYMDSEIRYQARTQGFIYIIKKLVKVQGSKMN